MAVPPAPPPPPERGLGVTVVERIISRSRSVSTITPLPAPVALSAAAAAVIIRVASLLCSRALLFTFAPFIVVSCWLSLLIASRAESGMRKFLYKLLMNKKYNEGDNIATVSTLIYAAAG